MANPSTSTSTSLRRSQRLLLQSTKATTTTTPISSSVHIKTLFNSPPSSLTQQDLSLKKTRQRPTAKISKNSIGSSGIPKKSINGSTKSTEMINGVEGFLRLRRSPRFSNIGLNITDKEVVESRKRKTRQSIEKDESKQGVNCGIEARSKSEQCKENFRYPLRSIGNILGRPNGNGGEVKKSVKSIYRSSEPIHGGSRQSKNRKNVLIDLFDQEIALDVTKKGHVEEEERTLTLALIGSDKAIGEMKVGVGAPSSKDNIRKIEGPRMPNSLVVFREGGANTSRNANMQIKEISNQSGNQGGLQEWTEDQELALQRAYLAAKPSPHFWKKVSKLVPGKSAQECFDKIHSDTITPPQPQPRSRAKKTNLSPLGHFALSGTKLLEPAELNNKRSRPTKQKKCLAHKTVRHLLQKHNQVDQGSGVDLFSVLEPAINSSTQSPSQYKILGTPACSLKKNGFQDYCERSSSSHKKPRQLSRFRDSSQTTVVSPPVLKQIKNKALHEKYIDQLHCREARRMAGGRGRINSKEDKTDGNVQNMDVIQVARNALVSDAREMITQFQYLEANPMSDCGDFNDDDDGDVSGEDEGEDEP